MRASLAQLVLRFAELGSECAYVYRRGYRTRRWSYAKVARTATQFARELEARGIAKGDRVLLWGENSAEWAAAFWGCVLRGVIVVPMDAAATPEFANRIATQVKAKLVVSSQNLNIAGIPGIVIEELEELLSGQASTTLIGAGLSRDDVLQIIFTSGTTADPKGVIITHGNVLANLEPLELEIAKYKKYERLVHPLRFVNLLPLSHVFGQFLGLFVPQALGATVVFHDSLNPTEVMRTIRQERASVLIAVPRMIASLQQKIERDFEEQGRAQEFRERFESADGKHFSRRWWVFRDIHKQFGWKFWAFISGGAALDEQTERFWSRLAFAVVQGYGLTETTSLISVNNPFKIGKRSIGKVLPGREMKLDPATGEILVRGQSVAKSYWRGEQAQSEQADGGWFHTGDLGELDAEGNLYFKGRKKNVIVTPAGMNVYPEDLEDALRAQPNVRDCVVIGLAVEGNAEPCAVLLIRDGDAEAAVRAANQTLSEYQHIRRWLVWPEQDFPRTPTQKPKIALIAEFARQYFATDQPAIAAPAGTVAELIERITHRRVGQLASNARLETDLNLSSIDRVELMSALEDRLQMDLDETRISEAMTVGDLEKLLHTANAGTPGAIRPQANTYERRYAYPRWTQRWPTTWLRPIIYYTLTWPATMLLAKPRVIGRENLAELRTPALLVCNHVTYIDVGFVMAALPTRMRTRIATAMQGERLIDMRNGRSGVTGDTGTPNLFMRAIYKLSYALTVALFNVFPLPQRSGFRESFEFAGDSADKGYSVLVFPEGRRTDSGELQTFQSGVGLLASKLNLPVVPIRIDGLFEAARQSRWFVPPDQLTVRIGPAVGYPADAAPETIARDLERRVREL